MTTFTKEQYLQLLNEMYVYADLKGSERYLQTEPAHRAYWLLYWLCPSLPNGLFRSDHQVLDAFLDSVSVVRDLASGTPIAMMSGHTILKVGMIREQICARITAVGDKCEITSQVLNCFYRSLPMTKEGHAHFKEIDPTKDGNEYLGLLRTHSIQAEDLLVMMTAFINFTTQIYRKNQESDNV